MLSDGRDNLGVFASSECVCVFYPLNLFVHMLSYVTWQSWCVSVHVLSHLSVFVHVLPLSVFVTVLSPLSVFMNALPPLSVFSCVISSVCLCVLFPVCLWLCAHVVSSKCVNACVVRWPRRSGCVTSRR